MDWGAKIFAYCERGLDPGFWAEPLNAVSNVAFLIAAGVALQHWRRTTARSGGKAELALIALVAVIGVGSFMFHTLATRWAAIADTAPIGVFMLAYLGYALRTFADQSWSRTGAALVLFAASLWAVGQIRCGSGTCLNGSLGYAPALAALLLLGAWLGVRRHPAAGALITGGGVFLVSLTFRTLDRTVCPATALTGGGPLGTHFIWHLANATLLYLLARAALLHGRARA